MECRAEAVDEGVRAEAGRGTRTRAVRAQALLHRAQEQPQGGTLERGLAFQDVAQPLRHRENPLPHGQAWRDVIGEMYRPPPYAGCCTMGTPRALARQRNREVVTALPAPGQNHAQGLRIPGNGETSAPRKPAPAQHFRGPRNSGQARSRSAPESVRQHRRQHRDRHMHRRVSSPRVGLPGADPPRTPFPEAAPTQRDSRPSAPHSRSLFAERASPSTPDLGRRR